MRAAPAARPPYMAFLAIAALPVASHLVIMATRHVRPGLSFGFGGLFKLGFVTVSALTHWGIYASLLAAFGLTLRAGREPLITAMARRMHGLTPELESYTRKVTIAWTLFFATQLSLSVALFCLAPLVVWSFFVNILDLPLVALMFAAEYAVRLRSLSDPPRHSLAAIMGMVTGCMQPDAMEPEA
jgi:uncharacterized membrane protein